MMRIIQKTTIFVLSLVLLLVVVPTGIFTVTVNAATSGLYTYEVSDGEATIIGVDESISGAVTIPSTLGGYPVTAIGGYAFHLLTNLTSITIPEGVTNIGEYAFENCLNLTSITIPGSLKSIDSFAFRYCDKLTKVYITDLASWCNIEFDSSPMGGNLYLNNELVTDLVVPDSVTRISSAAFCNCDSLVSVTIGNNVKEIGAFAFDQCQNLSMITIPDSVTTIGMGAFQDCRKLASLTIGKGITSIGDDAFWCCFDLAKVHITDLASWCAVNFEDGTSNPLHNQDAALYLNDKEVLELVIPEGVAVINSFAFTDCYNLTSLTLPKSLTNIQEWAFDACDGITDIWYAGTQSDKSKMHIEKWNDCLTSATWHYNDCSEHKFSAWVTTKEPSCETKGQQTRTCSLCAKTETKEVMVLGHSFLNSIVSKKPTCTDQGIKTGKCIRCNKTTTESIPATGHKIGAWKQIKAPNCMEKGVEQRNCANSGCDKTEKREVAVLGHIFKNATVTKQPTCTETGVETGICTRCKKETANTIKAKGHNFGVWTEAKVATCTANGIQKSICTVCGEEKSKTIDALGHEFENPTIVKVATIFSTGLKQGNCVRCREVTSEVIPCSYYDESLGILFETSEGVFAKGTELNIKEIEEGDILYESIQNILMGISNKFVAYDITAALKGAVLQPVGEVTVTFDIPEDFGADVVIYFIGENEKEELQSVVAEDGKTISVNLSHFSTYAVCELTGEDISMDAEEKDSNNLLSWIIILIVGVLLAGGTVVTIFFVKGKRDTAKF